MKGGFNDLWPLRRLNAKPRYATEQDREYAARVRKNKQKVAADDWHERKRAEREALKARNAPILKANEKAEARRFERIVKIYDKEREERNRKTLLVRLKAARAQGNARSLRRCLQQRAATPKWANKGAMMSLYAKAKRMQLTTGIKHHVDHIVPLQHRLVCGLHCEQNMQVLTKRENLKKLNSWWPDMP